ncbi:hypothetical protein [Paraburkholderia adhaesiva]|uniref:hypothetical protein n=1 Tax=Paraburkholderia adhaesiva TaxID=2883244 RepID=UPI001F28252C|nr:hypothetical protein [Paraburkholderia adhaesiva]
MNDKPDSSRNTGAGSPPDFPEESVVHIPGAVRTDFPDGSHLVEGPDGDKFLVSESGSINGNLPFIRRVQIEDLSRVLSHHVAHVHDTTSHTLHFVGGGVLSYLHLRNGSGMTLKGNNILFRTLPDGVIVVSGTFNHGPRQ